ncbi:MAG TPA: glycosyl hydrolase [Terrimicrobiaceae bacterium]|nr:glycosyl hydrolase [Terrimicrobiaceae bacterium]
MKLPSAALILLWAGAACCGGTVHAQNSLRPDADAFGRLLVPENGAYTGAYIDFGEAEDDVTLERIENFESAVGKHQAIIASSSYWGQQTFPGKNLAIITRHGAIPLIYWSPWDKPYEQDRGPDQFSLEQILAGKWDAYIDSWAKQARSFGRPFFVAWGLEMNGTWFPWSGYFYGGGKPSGPGAFSGPELYKKAYRYVVDRVRMQGADNILWVFHANNYSYPLEDWNALARYYPGDAYVDWLGISAYGKQFAHDPWVSAEDCLIYGYDELCALNPGKPVMLAEWGIGEFPKAGSKAEWITRAFATMRTRLPRLKAAVFWNERWENEDGTYSNLRATSSPGALDAYRSGVADAFWLSSPKYRKP